MNIFKIAFFKMDVQKLDLLILIVWPQKSFRGQSFVPQGSTQKRGLLYFGNIFVELGMRPYTCATEL